MGFTGGVGGMGGAGVMKRRAGNKMWIVQQDKVLVLEIVQLFFGRSIWKKNNLHHSKIFPDNHHAIFKTI
jgi:hypothetical protein